jgi:hypothetical protein
VTRGARVLKRNTILIADGGRPRLARAGEIVPAELADQISDQSVFEEVGEPVPFTQRHLEGQLVAPVDKGRATDPDVAQTAQEGGQTAPAGSEGGETPPAGSEGGQTAADGSGEGNGEDGEDGHTPPPLKIVDASLDEQGDKPYADRGNTALQSALKARDLATSGNKETLVARLEAYDREVAALGTAK